MNGKFTLTFIFNSMILAAFAVLFYGCSTAQSSKSLPHNEALGKFSPTATPVSDEIPHLEIKSDEVSALELETVYKNFFEEGSKCRKTYNEYFGNADGASSPSSPCRINMSFDREGNAAKTIAVWRHDKAAKEMKVVEKSVWTASVSRAQFDALAKNITDNAAFKAWQDGMMITVSNSSVSATHPKGTRTVMSNVDEKTVQFLPMLDAFRKLDKEIKWEKKQ